MKKSVRNGICNADTKEIDEILNLAVARRQELYPDWDMVYLAIPKGASEGTREIFEKLMEEDNRETASETGENGKT